MPWYVAELIVRCQAGKRPRRDMLFGRQFKVLRASTPKAAYRRALELGRAENHRYKNPAGETVSWQFVGLANLEPLLEEEIRDGTEIHSRLESGNPQSEVRHKEELTVFWAVRNRHQTARELLAASGVAKPSVPKHRRPSGKRGTRTNQKSCRMPARRRRKP